MVTTVTWHNYKLFEINYSIKLCKIFQHLAKLPVTMVTHHTHSKFSIIALSLLNYFDK